MIRRGTLRREGRSVEALARALGPAALPLDHASDWDPLLERVGEARVVLLGEATHGTREFYALRAGLTRRLIEEKGFTVVAVEADWPDAYRVNRWVRGAGRDRGAVDALGDFRRFPLWMWRNTEVVAFLEWLRGHNDRRPAAERAGFYGLDLYGLHASIEAVIAYLERVDPGAAERARRRYGCLDHAGDEPQEYGWSVSLRLRRACRDQVVEQLVELRREAARYLARDGLVAEDEHFFAQESARLIVSAEEYYREMFGRRINTWNLRDLHMHDALVALLEHLSRRGPPVKAVVWAHNSHVGDARATEQHDQGELDLGQLARERWGDAAALVGMTTFEGEVTAASSWGGELERKRVRPALHGSVEQVLHAVGRERLLVPLDDPRAREALDEPRLERAIGVIYLPGAERLSHYLRCHVPEQFDALVHVDRTTALEPLDRTSRWDTGEPEAYPTGL